MNEQKPTAMESALRAEISGLRANNDNMKQNIKMLVADRDRLESALMHIDRICEATHGKKDNDLLQRIALSEGPGKQLCAIQLIARLNTRKPGTIFTHAPDC